MSEKSGAFLTKSIMLLCIFLVCIGTSMWLGKQLGRTIMDTTKSNLSEHFPEAEMADGDTEFMLDPSGNRSSFGFTADNFAPARFNEEWADPPEDELVPGEEGPTVTVTPLDPNDPDNPEGNEPDGGDGSGDDNADGGSDDSIFDLGDSSTYRIQVGTYSSKDNAEGVWNDLTQAGYNASISTFADENDETQYRVTVGVYHTLEEANEVADRIRSMGFGGWVQEIKSE